MFHIRFHTNRDEVDIRTPHKVRSDESCLVIMNPDGKSFTSYPWHLITTPIFISYYEEDTAGV